MKTFSGFLFAALLALMFTGIAQAGPKELVDPCDITTCGKQEVSGPKEVKGLPKATAEDASGNITLKVPRTPGVFLPQVSANWTVLVMRQDLISHIADPALVVVTMRPRTSGGSIRGTTRSILTEEKAPSNTVLFVAIDATSPDGWISWFILHTPASNIEPLQRTK